MGIDDFAWRKGYRYGILICDAVTHHPIDLLPDRETATLAQWIQGHPELTHITRDRYVRFQDIITTHAPAVIQIHDRFHLIQNLWTLHDRIIRKVLPVRIDLGMRSPPPVPPPQTKAEHHRLENAQRKWAQARTLQKYHAQGYSISRLSRQFNLHWKTVERYLGMTGVPDTTRQKRPKLLDAFHKSVIHWEADGDSVRAIYEKLLEIGYKGSYGSVKDFVADLRKRKRVAAPLDIEYHSRRDIRRILWQNHLEVDAERDIINRILQQYPKLQPVYAFVAGFRECIAEKDHVGFTELILFEQQRRDPLTKHFIRRLLTDFKPTVHALMYNESNGFVEGNVNRLKTIKRIMYGRAGFRLLRQRMLYRPL